MGVALTKILKRRSARGSVTTKSEQFPAQPLNYLDVNPTK